jgi:formamidopyrimidine-DNA glycosylase
VLFYYHIACTIYACESLHKAGIGPERKANSVSKKHYNQVTKKTVSSEFLLLCAISLEGKYVQNVWNPFLSHHRLSVEEKHYFVQCTHPFLFK